MCFGPLTQIVSGLAGSRKKCQVQVQTLPVIQVLASCPRLLCDLLFQFPHTPDLRLRTLWTRCLPLCPIWHCLPRFWLWFITIPWLWLRSDLKSRCKCQGLEYPLSEPLHLDPGSQHYLSLGCLNHRSSCSSSCFWILPYNLSPTE